MSRFTKDTTVEELIRLQPTAVGTLIQFGLPCVVCGEPFWGTIGELAQQKAWDNDQIAELLLKLNEL